MDNCEYKPTRREVIKEIFGVKYNKILSKLQSFKEYCSEPNKLRRFAHGAKIAAIGVNYYIFNYPGFSMRTPGDKQKKLEARLKEEEKSYSESSESGKSYYVDSAGALGLMSTTVTLVCIEGIYLLTSLANLVSTGDLTGIEGFSFVHESIPVPNAACLVPIATNIKGLAKFKYRLAEERVIAKHNA